MHFREMMQHRREILRNLANNHYEKMPDGRILVPSMGMAFGGGVETDVNGRDVRFDGNLLPTEGLDHAMNVILHGGAQVGTWYVAPFVLNSAPNASLTAATFDSTLQELTEYNESTRQAYVESASSGGSISNAASKAQFSINATVNNWGLVLISDSTKEGVTGTLLAAIKYAAVRALQNGDILGAQYTLAGSSV